MDVLPGQVVNGRVVANQLTAHSGFIVVAVEKHFVVIIAGKQINVSPIGNKGLGFMQRLNAKIVSHITGLGDTPHLAKLIGPVKVQLDLYSKGEIDSLYIVYTRFINTMKQEPAIEQLLPLPADRLTEDAHATKGTWDYIYEPDPKEVLEQLLVRYIEQIVYQSVAENMASEQSARMVARKAAIPRWA